MSKPFFLRDRITAIIGISLLATLIGASYLYSIQTYLSGLKYIPSPNSPDFKAVNIEITDFNANGSPKQRLTAKTLEHFTDNRLNSTNVQYVTLNPNTATLSIKANRAWSDDGLQTIELQGNVSAQRAPFGQDPSMYFSTHQLKGYLDTYTFETKTPASLRWGIDTTESQGGLHYDHIGRNIELLGGVTSIIRSTTNPKKNAQ